MPARFHVSSFHQYIIFRLESSIAATESLASSWDQYFPAIESDIPGTELKNINE